MQSPGVIVILSQIAVLGAAGVREYTVRRAGVEIKGKRRGQVEKKG